MHEPATQQVLTQPCGILVIQIHAADFNGIDKREFENVVVQDLDDVWIGMNIDAGQPVNATHELAITARVIRSPAPTLRREEIAATELGTTKLRGRRRHSSAV